MTKLGISIALLWAALITQPALAETWDCGESVAKSVAFTINTDTSACGGNTIASGRFIIATDLCGSQGFAQAGGSVVIDTIWSPGSIKKHPLGERVTLMSLPIARAFAQRFYIEAVDRTSGIGVMAGVTADPGRLATVTGTLTNVEGEIVLDSPDITFGELGAAPKPLGMNSCALRLGIGVDPTGILARVWGKAISVPEGETYYLVSDACFDGAQHGSGCMLTVLPEGVPRPAEGSDVILTGIPGVATVAGQTVRVFRVNAQ